MTKVIVDISMSLRRRPPLFVDGRRQLLVQRAVRVSATATQLVYEFET